MKGRSRAGKGVKIKIKILKPYKSFIPGRWIRIIAISDIKSYERFFSRFFITKRKHNLEDIKFPGIYSFFSGKKCIYIGESTNIGRRLRNHLTKYVDGEWNGYKNIIIAVRRDKKKFESRMLEARLIYKIKPELNKREIAIYTGITP